jgi:hypothetical protein
MRPAASRSASGQRAERNHKRRVFQAAPGKAPMACTSRIRRANSTSPACASHCSRRTSHRGWPTCSPPKGESLNEPAPRSIRAWSEDRAPTVPRPWSSPPVQPACGPPVDPSPFGSDARLLDGEPMVGVGPQLLDACDVQPPAWVVRRSSSASRSLGAGGVKCPVHLGQPGPRPARPADSPDRRPMPETGRAARS